MKHRLPTSENSTSDFVFVNVCLVAADANNEDHIKWVGKFDVRNRIYMIINEQDSAQNTPHQSWKITKTRLGHYLKTLRSPNVA